MMAKVLIDTTHITRPAGAYSSCLRAGDFVFVAGTLSIDEQGNRVGETIEEQTAHILETLQDVLHAAGASLDDIVKATVFLSDYSLFERYNQVYSRYFSDPKPTRMTCGVQLREGYLIEIEVVAYTGE
ncbi:MAG TPA: RidA family protein [Ktedonobacterales bacterium]|jgi:2-iminobutanoate/2-iminopropanoate deaminase